MRGEQNHAAALMLKAACVIITVEKKDRERKGKDRDGREDESTGDRNVPASDGMDCSS